MGPSVENALLRKEMEDLRQEVHELKTSVADLVDAWKAANGVVNFIKWLSGGAVALTSLYFLIKAK